LVEYGCKQKPVLYYKVRWSGAYNMLKAYMEIRGYLLHFEGDDEVDTNEDPETIGKRLTDFIPDQGENEMLKGLLSTLESYQCANMITQSTGFNILKARRLFRRLIEENDRLVQYLGPNSAIIDRQFRSFESGLYKLASMQQQRNNCKFYS
jgi:hypothetical protein